MIQKSKKLICGVGINDANYVIGHMVDGKLVLCPFYRRWSDMINRAYNKKLHGNNPTYIGTTVSEEWHYFMKFREWMITQSWEGKELDKDILKPGNKHYSKETCVFVSRELNGLLANSAAKRGMYPQGVSWNKRDKKFQARTSIRGKTKSLGHYDTVEEARKAYIKEKIDYILLLSRDASTKVKHGLNLHIKAMEVDGL